MMTGFDTVSGSRLYWKEKDYTTKNTCSNGPEILVALQVYNATAKKQVSWPFFMKEAALFPGLVG
jgi:hypothetical protein